MRSLPETRDPHEIARLLNITIGEAREMLDAADSYLPGWGKPSWHKHILSRRHLDDDWPSAHRGRLALAADARREGRLLMCQGRDGPYVIQYGVPRSC